MAWAQVDDQGHLVVPPEVAAQLGLVPGAQVRLEPGRNGLRLHRPVTHLAKLYVEPTNACNLDCATCFRHGWDEPIGRMSEASFAAILDGLAALDELPTVYFGGIGEPLSHRQTVSWVAQAHALGARTELITNGMLLNERMGRELIDAGLDLLVGVHRRRNARRATPTCGWAPSWRRSSPTWHASVNRAKAATTPVPSSGSHSWP